MEQSWSTAQSSVAAYARPAARWSIHRKVSSLSHAEAAAHSTGRSAPCAPAAVWSKAAAQTVWPPAGAAEGEVGVALSGAEAVQPSEAPVAWAVLRLPEAVGVAPMVAWRPAAVRPSAVPWAFRRDRDLPWPVRRRVARFARAIRMSRVAPPSERSWQAARCEGLS